MLMIGSLSLCQKKKEYDIYILLNLGSACGHFFCLLAHSMPCFFLLWSIQHLNLSYIQ